jgi:hypothetical protein
MLGSRLRETGGTTHMRSACVTLAWWAAWAALGVAAAQASGPTPNVVAEHVRPIRADEGAADTAVLLVFVVDDAGDPMDAVAVTVLDAGKEIASGESDARGRALLRLTFAGPVVVRAVESGLVPSEARGVLLRKAGLTAVVLPLAASASRPAK